TDFDIFSKYKRALVICLRKGCETAISNLSIIYQKIIKTSDLEELSRYYTLVKVSVKLLKNKHHRMTSLILERPILTIFNSSNMMLENQEIIIPCLDLKEDNIDIINHMYEPPYNFESMMICNVLYKYFSCSSYTNLEKMSVIFNNIKESDYWTNKYHC